MGGTASCARSSGCRGADGQPSRDEAFAARTPLPRGARRAAARRCSSSRTSTGRTTTCSTSSTSSPTGSTRCRCSLVCTAQTGAAHAPPRLGRRQAERADAVARTALRRRDGATVAGAARSQRAARRDAGRAHPPGRGRAAVRRGVRPDAGERRFGQRSSPRPCRGSSRPASTASPPRTRRCCRTRPSSARCSGRTRSRPCPGCRLERARGLSAQARATGVRAARAALGRGRRAPVRVPARAGAGRRLRADPARAYGRTSTGGRRSGSLRSRPTAPRIAPRCSHYPPRVGDRVRRGSRGATSTICGRSPSPLCVTPVSAPGG